MKLKKLLAAVTAAALAVTAMAVTSFTASAMEFVSAPSGTETHLADMVKGDGDGVSVAGTSLNAYGSVWVKCYDGGMKRWVTDPKAYVKLTVGPVADYDNGAGEKTPFDDLITWENISWFDFVTMNGQKINPVTGASAAEAVVYMSLNGLTVDEWGGVGFNIQAGHCGFTIKSVEIVKFGTGAEDPVGEWIKKASNKYYFVSDSSSKKPEAFFLPLSEMLETGKTLEDIESVTATFETESGNGILGGNDPATGDWNEGIVPTWSKSNPTVSFEVSSKNVDSIQVHVYWINPNDDCTMTLSIKYKEGGSTSTDPVIDTITLNARVTGLEVDDTFQLVATVKDTEGNVMPDAEVTWTSSDTSIATVSETGLVTGVAEGEVTITAAADATHTAECKFNVFVMPTVPTISPANPSIKVGETVQMSVLSAEGKTIEWEVYDPSVATIDANGLVTAVGVGTTEIRAYLDGEGKDNGTFPYTLLTVTAAPVNPPVVDPTPDDPTPVDPTPDDPKPDDPKPDDPTHTHTPATVWSSDATNHWHACSGCTDKLDLAAHTSDSGTVTTPATATTTGTKEYKCTVCGYVVKTETIPATGTGDTPTPAPAPAPASPEVPGYGVVIPVMNNNGTNSNTPVISGDSSKSGWDAISEEALTASDGTKIEVNMNGSTKVPSSVFNAIKDKDVDIVFNMGRGIKWTVNGLSVTKASNINFDFSKNTRHIPDEVVDAAEGSYKKQLSLDHNGNFGFAAVMTYDIGTKYNGSYANLFYYNPKSKELELIDCSLISGGKASFVLTHASDYLITITEEPLGEFEDVSAASGIASDSDNVNAAVFAAVLAVITAAFGVVVYKKRRHN